MDEQQRNSCRRLGSHMNEMQIEVFNLSLKVRPPANGKPLGKLECLDQNKLTC
jgi:hypothetical protein